MIPVNETDSEAQAVKTPSSWSLPNVQDAAVQRVGLMGVQAVSVLFGLFQGARGKWGMLATGISLMFGMEPLVRRLDYKIPARLEKIKQDAKEMPFSGLIRKYAVGDLQTMFSEKELLQKLEEELQGKDTFQYQKFVERLLSADRLTIIGKTVSKEKRDELERVIAILGEAESIYHRKIQELDLRHYNRQQVQLQRLQVLREENQQEILECERQLSILQMNVRDTSQGAYREELEMLKLKYQVTIQRADQFAQMEQKIRTGEEGLIDQRLFDEGISAALQTKERALKEQKGELLRIGRELLSFQEKEDSSLPRITDLLTQAPNLE